MPTHVFEVVSQPNSPAEGRFRQHAENRKKLYAFHGSKVDSFYSIVNFGLQQHLCKVRWCFEVAVHEWTEHTKRFIFGSVSRRHCSVMESIYHQKCMSAYRSVLLVQDGNHRYVGMNCLALHCANSLIILSTWNVTLKVSFDVALSHTNWQIVLPDQQPNERENERKNNQHVPDKYFVITNNDIVRVRYLLMFAKPADKPLQVHRNPVMNWIYNNKSVATMVFYAVILLSVGLANSRTGQYFRQIFWQKAQRFISDVKTKYFSL